MNTTTSNPKSSKMATTSMVMGILSIFIGWLTLAILPIIAIILGHKAQGKVRRSAGALTGEGMAVAGYITGYVSLGLLIPMLGIIAAITVPAYQDFTLRARTAVVHATTTAHRRIIADQLEGGVSPGELSIDPTTIGLKAPDQYRTRDIEGITYDNKGVITLTFSNIRDLSTCAGRTIVYVPDLLANGKVRWRIDRQRSTLPLRFLPRL